MRIVGGKFAGRDLTSPGKTRVRPTSEHVRAALLDALRGDVDGARILDLYAGTGALGLEALSRGAKYADFVEMNSSALHALKANVAKFRLKERARIYFKDAIHFADALPENRYDICFADPPYESKQLDWLIRIWHERRFSRVLAVEHAASHAIPKGQGVLTFEHSMVTIYRQPAVVMSEDGAASASLPNAAGPTAGPTIPPDKASAASPRTGAAHSRARPGSRPRTKRRPK